MSVGSSPGSMGEVSAYNWRDVTAMFQDASAELSRGELLHDANFGLFEAMSAIEMMDPKMDAGMLCNQGIRKIQSLEHGIEIGEVKISNLSDKELVAIMDATFCCLVTWLEGHSTAQTLFTNVYLHNPFVIEDVSLKSFCIATLRMIDLVRDLCNRASAYEEEDFQPLTYGFKLAPEVTDVRASGMLKEAEDELQRRIRNVRAKSAECNGNHEGENKIRPEQDEAASVAARIKLLRHFLLALTAFSKEKCAGVTEAQRHLTLMRESLASVAASRHKDNCEEVEDYPKVMGFEQRITQRLLPPTFPRYSRIKSWKETVGYLSSFLDRLDRATRALSLNNLHLLVDFFSQFSRSSPCVLSRSLLQLMVVPPNRRLFGTNQLADSFKETLKTFIQPPVFNPKCPISGLPQAKEAVDAYLTRVSFPVVSLFLLFGHNRARQRDKWVAVLEEFVSLQEESEKLDQFLQSQWIKFVPGKPFFASFTTWNLYHVILAMIAYTETGFELELYAAHEYTYVLWYLGEFLYGWLLSTLSRADNYLTQNTAYCDELQKSSKSNKKNKKNKNKKNRPYAREILFLQANQNLLLGTYKAVLAFQQEGRMSLPKFEFDSEEVRFNRRFAPFACIATPPAIPYAQYAEITDLSRHDQSPTFMDLFSLSLKHFSQAKGMYESLQAGEYSPAPGMPQELSELENLIKISKTNYVVIKLLMGGHKSDKKDKPEWDFSLHPTYPIIKI